MGEREKNGTTSNDGQNTRMRILGIRSSKSKVTATMRISLALSFGIWDLGEGGRGEEEDQATINRVS